MDPRYLPEFERRANDLSRTPPYDWLSGVIAEEVATILRPHGVELRADGMVFLLLNIGDLVVKPWQEVNSQQFLGTQYVDLVRQDVQYLLRIGLVAAQTQQRSVVSSNMLLQGAAVLGEGLTVRSLQLWGPPP
jgi:hypothetical protein